MDQDRDGTISVDDLKEVYNSLGKIFIVKQIKQAFGFKPPPTNHSTLNSHNPQALNYSSSSYFVFINLN
jgi:hypothetical protein